MNYLDRWGLSDKDAEVDGFSYCEIKIGNDISPAIKIPFDLVILPEVMTPFGFVRYRILGSGGNKYHQSEKGVQVRFSNLYPEWENVRKSNSPIYVTEGEFKAAFACKMGLPTVAICGVSMWHATRSKLIHPTFAQFGITGRKVIVVFDSDKIINDQVLKEQNALCKALHLAGAKPYIVDLPPSTKGMDDYLRENGLEEFRRLSERYYKDADTLDSLQNILAFCPNENSYYYFDYGRCKVWQKSALVDFLSCGQQTKDSLLEAWLRYPNRRKVEGGNQFPGEGPWVEWQGGLWANTYIDDFPQPGENDVTSSIGDSLIRLLNGILVDQRDVNTFLLWAGYPLVHKSNPKLPNYIYLYSRSQGTGKSLLMSSIASIYGLNGHKTNLEEIVGVYNTHVKYLFCYCDEAVTSRHDARAIRNAMKELTSPTALLREMYKGPRMVKSFSNYVFATNDLSSIAVEDGDRRAIIIALKERPLDADDNPLCREWYEDYVIHAEARRGELYSFLIDYYHRNSGEEDVTTMRIAKRAEIKVSALRENYTSLEATIHDLIINLEEELGVESYPYELLDTSILYSMVVRNHSRKISKQEYRQTLNKLNLYPLKNHTSMKSNNVSPYFVAIRNAEEWRHKDTVKEINEYLRLNPTILTFQPKW